MRTADIDILIVPGWSSSGPDHWQSRWERNLKSARRIEQEDWLHPNRDQWVGRIVEAVATTDSDRPVVLVGHSLGVAAIVHAAGKLPSGSVAGAFLVAPADVDNASAWPITQGQTFAQEGAGFAPLPTTTLPFPSTLIASHTDPYCTTTRAEELAAAWGSELLDIGDAGHINVDSGHGPWPDGLIRFGWFLRRLGGDGTPA